MDEDTLELLDSLHALLDKVIITDFVVENIEDLALLQQQGIATTKENAINYIHTAYGERYNSIKIGSTNLFHSFTYALTNDGQHIMAELSIGVTPDDYHNLNCFSADDYRHKLVMIQEFLALEMGIYVDFSDAKYKSIEINKTIVLDNHYSKYSRVLNLLMYLLPGTLRLKGEVDYTERHKHPRKLSDFSDKTETYYKSSGKRGLEIKVYNKRRQLEEEYGIELCHNFLRYEITLKTSSKIKAALGTNKVQLLDDTQVNRYFSGFILTNVALPYQNYCRKSEKEVLKILRQNYQPGSRTWTRDVLLQIANHEITTGIPLILDISELLPLLCNLPFENKDCKKRAKKTFMANCSNNLIALFQNDNTKCIEVLEKLQ